MRHFRPVQDLEAAIEVLDHRRTTLHPVAIVAIDDPLAIADLSRVNVTTNDAIEAAASRFANYCFFVIADVLDGIFDLVFQIRRQ